MKNFLLFVGVCASALACFLLVTSFVVPTVRERQHKQKSILLYNKCQELINS